MDGSDLSFVGPGVVLCGDDMVPLVHGWLDVGVALAVASILAVLVALAFPAM